MIEAQGLTRYYGDTLAVEGVSFSLSEGEIVGLLGHNGAGKSTILKLITGALEPDSGEVRMDGSAMGVADDAVKSKIGYLPENLPLYHDMQVVDYLDYMASMHGLDGQAARDAVVQSMKTTELEQRTFNRIDHLSRGFKQRVGVAQAILHDPKYVILDEPTNGLDPSQTLAMRRLLKRLSKRSAVLVSTHVLQEVNAVCDRVLILRAGKLAVDQPLAALSASNRLMLTSDAALDKVCAAVSSVDWVTQVTEEDDGYALEVIDGARIDDRESIARLVRALVDAGVPVSGLGAVRKDLEALFREVTEAHHAA
ncbi:MAG: ABC transporter ATP-binding protein [Gammaproteobacteria bacterium]|nr:ABC transporter ATP-binding protein [Gammaproteobacteria bacterium]MCY4323824.1 ABC transporter ATP-binding protein [Gammaproteobacteria bacterium]